MKRLLLFTLLLTTIIIYSTAQTGSRKLPGDKNSVLTAPVSDTSLRSIRDTIDVSSFKYVKFDKGGISVQSLRDARWLLTPTDLNNLFGFISKLPYDESARAIEILKQFFGLTSPQK